MSEQPASLLADTAPPARPVFSRRVQILGCLLMPLLLACGLAVACGVAVLALGGTLAEFGQRRTELDVLQDLYTSASDTSWRLRPQATLQYQRTEFDVRVSVNSQSFRADREYDLVPPAGTVRILTLGDSFVEALQVDVGETFSAVLERCLNEAPDTATVEVINGGVSNYSPGDAMLLYEHMGSRYRPDLVILTLYLGNDFLDLLREMDGITFRYGGFTYALDNGGQITWQRVGPPELLADLRQGLLDNQAIWRIVTRLGGDVTPYDGALVQAWGQRPTNEAGEPYGMEPRLYLYDVRYPNVPAQESNGLNRTWGIMQAVVLRLRDLVEQNNGRLAVLLLPPWEVLRDGDWDWFQSQATSAGTTLDRSRPQMLLTTWLGETGIPVLDLTPDVAAALEAGRSLFLISDGHFSGEGQRFAGERLCAFVQDENLITDSQ